MGCSSSHPAAIPPSGKTVTDLAAELSGTLRGTHVNLGGQVMQCPRSSSEGSASWHYMGIWPQQVGSWDGGYDSTASLFSALSRSPKEAMVCCVTGSDTKLSDGTLMLGTNDALILDRSCENVTLEKLIVNGSPLMPQETLVTRSKDSLEYTTSVKWCDCALWKWLQRHATDCTLNQCTIAVLEGAKLTLKATSISPNANVADISREPAENTEEPSIIKGSPCPSDVRAGGVGLFVSGQGTRVEMFGGLVYKGCQGIVITNGAVFIGRQASSGNLQGRLMVKYCSMNGIEVHGGGVHTSLHLYYGLVRMEHGKVGIRIHSKDAFACIKHMTHEGASAGLVVSGGAEATLHRCTSTLAQEHVAATSASFKLHIASRTRAWISGGVGVFSGSSVTLKECWMQRNSTSGIHISGSKAKATLLYCCINDNHEGVAIRDSGSASLTKCYLGGNKQLDYDNGATTINMSEMLEEMFKDIRNPALINFQPPSLAGEYANWEVDGVWKFQQGPLHSPSVPLGCQQEAPTCTQFEDVTALVAQMSESTAGACIDLQGTVVSAPGCHSAGASSWHGVEIWPQYGNWNYMSTYKDCVFTAVSRSAEETILCTVTGGVIILHGEGCNVTLTDCTLNHCTVAAMAGAKLTLHNTNISPNAYVAEIHNKSKESDQENDWRALKVSGPNSSAPDKSEGGVGIFATGKGTVVKMMGGLVYKGAQGISVSYGAEFQGQHQKWDFEPRTKKFGPLQASQQDQCRLMVKYSKMGIEVHGKGSSLVMKNALVRHDWGAMGIWVHSGAHASLDSLTHENASTGFEFVDDASGDLMRCSQSMSHIGVHLSRGSQVKMQECWLHENQTCVLVDDVHKTGTSVDLLRCCIHESKEGVFVLRGDSPGLATLTECYVGDNRKNYEGPTMTIAVSKSIEEIKAQLRSPALIFFQPQDVKEEYAEWEVDGIWNFKK